MNKTAIVALAMLVALGCASTTDHWAVLVAGSNGFWNYRHQSDICHAYQMLRTKGYPADRIITLSYNDVAGSSRNPFPGKLFNKPNGNDVYKGCVMDYQGSDVTPANFLAVLSGDASKTNGKPVVQSTSADRIFVYFADHGAPGLIAFPSGELYAKDLISTLESMYANKKYKEMVLYIEACESGSMFDGLLSADWNIYATTAANPSESSWGYYCYPDDVVDGKHVGSCLGDLYSIKFLENADANDLTRETLSQQFDDIKKQTTKSHVMKYGTMNFINEVAGAFQGVLSPTGQTSTSIYSYLKDRIVSDEPQVESVAISSRDTKLHYLYSRHLEEGTHTSALDLQNELNHRMRVNYIFEQFKSLNNLKLHQPRPVRDFDCYKSLIETYKSQCGAFREYELKFAKYFVNSCEAGNPTDALVTSLTHICQNM